MIAAPDHDLPSWRNDPKRPLKKPAQRSDVMTEWPKFRVPLLIEIYSPSYRTPNPLLNFARHADVEESVFRSTVEWTDTKTIKLEFSVFV